MLPNGKEYNGNWSAGQREGQGTYRQYHTANKNIIIEEYSGTWLADQVNTCFHFCLYKTFCLMQKNLNSDMGWAISLPPRDNIKACSIPGKRKDRDS